MSAPTQPAVEPLVREFYANLPDRQEGTVFVRGADVPFTERVINQFFNLTNLDQDEYIQFKRSHYEDNIILLVIAKPDADWAVTKKQKKTIKGTQLTPMARLWQYFLSARLMLESHYSTVTHEKAVLLYFIATGKSIDVGDMIWNNIKQPCALELESRFRMTSTVFMLPQSQTQIIFKNISTVQKLRNQEQGQNGREPHKALPHHPAPQQHRKR